MLRLRHQGLNAEAGRGGPRRDPTSLGLMAGHQGTDQLAGGPFSMTPLSRGWAGGKEDGPAHLPACPFPRSGDMDDAFCSPLPPWRALGCSRGTEELLTPQGWEAWSLPTTSPCTLPTLALCLSLPGLCLSQPLGLELGAGSQKRLSPLATATSMLDSFLKRYRWDSGTDPGLRRWAGGCPGCLVSCFPLVRTTHNPSQRMT